MAQSIHKTRLVCHDRLKTTSQFPGLVPALVDQGHDLGGGRRLFQRLLGEPLFERFTHECNSGQVLTEAIVQVLPDSALFTVTDFRDGSFQALALSDINTGGENVTHASLLSSQNCRGPVNEAPLAISGD